MRAHIDQCPGNEFDLGVGEFRIERNAEKLRCLLLGNRKVSSGVVEILIRRLQMQRYRIMDSRCDAFFFQDAADFFTIPDTNNIEVIRMG